MPEATNRVKVNAENILTNRFSNYDNAIPRGDKTGVQYVHQANLEHSKDAVTTVPLSASTSDATLSASASNQQLLAANAARVGLVIGNNSNVALLWRASATAASASAFGGVIPAGQSLVIAGGACPKEAIQIISVSSPTGNIGGMEWSS